MSLRTCTPIPDTRNFFFCLSSEILRKEIDKRREGSWRLRTRERGEAGEAPPAPGQERSSGRGGGASGRGALCSDRPEGRGERLTAPSGSHGFAVRETRALNGLPFPQHWLFWGVLAGDAAQRGPRFWFLWAQAGGRDEGVDAEAPACAVVTKSSLCR